MDVAFCEGFRLPGAHPYRYLQGILYLHEVRMTEIVYHKITTAHDIQTVKSYVGDNRLTRALEVGCEVWAAPIGGYLARWPCGKGAWLWETRVRFGRWYGPALAMEPPNDI